MSKHLLCIILGIILFLLWNNRENFSIGAVRVGLWRNTETGMYILINGGVGGGFDPTNLERIERDVEINDDQFQELQQAIDQHPCENPIQYLNATPAEGVPPGVLECKIKKLTKNSGCVTCSTNSRELAELIQPLYDSIALQRAEDRLAFAKFSKCAAVSDDILEMIRGGVDSAHSIDENGIIHGGYFNIDDALNILSTYLSTRTRSQGGMQYAYIDKLFGLIKIIISLLRLGISSTRIIDILNVPYDSPEHIPLGIMRLEEEDIQIYILTAYLYVIDPLLVLDAEGNLNYELTLDDLIHTAHTLNDYQLDGA